MAKSLSRLKLVWLMWIDLSPPIESRKKKLVSEIYSSKVKGQNVKFTVIATPIGIIFILFEKKLRRSFQRIC